MAKKLKVQPDSTAVIYARYSSHAQNDASIEQQVAECTEYAQQNNIKITAVYEDRHITGRTDRRPGFQRMMRDAQTGTFRYVIAWKSNRMGRNMMEAMVNDSKLRDLDIRCLYVEEDFDDTAAGRFALRSMMNVNQFHSENMAEDIHRGLMDNARQCRVNGSAPFGYKRGEDGKFAIDEETAPIVQEIFRRIARGEMKASIARDLNERQIKTRKGGEWGKSSFAAILHNERYMGIYIYGDVRIPDGMPAIVSWDLFQEANEMDGAVKAVVKGRRRRDNMEYALTGKLYCGYCREPMVGTSGTSKVGRMYYYYRCKNQAVAHTCPKKPVRKDVVETVVVAALKAMVTTPENVEWMTDMVMKYRQRLIDNSDLGYLESRLQEIKKTIANVMKAIEMGVVTETTKSRLQELEAEQKEVLTGILMEKRAIPDVTREHVQFYFEQFRDGDVNDPKFRRTIIRHFLRAVYLYDDHMDIVFDYTDDDTPITIPIDSAPDTTAPDETQSVLISSPTVHHRRSSIRCGWTSFFVLLRDRGSGGEAALIVVD